MAFRLIAVTFFTLVLSAAAAAQPRVDAARAHYDAAEFDAALELLLDSSSWSDLSTSEQAELYATRALVHFALGLDAAMNKDLRSLAAVDPGFALPAEAPPTLRLEHEQICRELDVDSRNDEAAPLGPQPVASPRAAAESVETTPTPSTRRRLTPNVDDAGIGAWPWVIAGAVVVAAASVFGVLALQGTFATDVTLPSPVAAALR